MQKFSIKIDVEALEDIQKTTDWYNSVNIRIRSQISKTSYFSNFKVE